MPPIKEFFNALSYDPGGSTGWAHFSLPYYIEYGNWIWEGGTHSTQNHHTDIRDQIEFYNPDYVICEDFTFRQKAGDEDYRKGLELVSKEYIGVLRLLQKDFGFEFILQPASYKNTNLVRNENLDKLDILRHPLHPNRHYHDAAKHLTHWLIQKKRYQPFIDRIKS